MYACIAFIALVFMVRCRFLQHAILMHPLPFAEEKCDIFNNCSQCTFNDAYHRVCDLHVQFFSVLRVITNQ